MTKTLITTGVAMLFISAAAAQTEEAAYSPAPSSSQPSPPTPEAKAAALQKYGTVMWRDRPATSGDYTITAGADREKNVSPLKVTMSASAGSLDVPSGVASAPRPAPESARTSPEASESPDAGQNP